MAALGNWLGAIQLMAISLLHVGMMEESSSGDKDLKDGLSPRNSKTQKEA